MDFTAFKAQTPTEKLFEDIINRVAQLYGVPACALAAIARRESNFDDQAHSDDGGWGICQITSDVDANGVHTPTGLHMLIAANNFHVAAQWFLHPAINACIALREAYPDSMGDEVLKYAFEAYNGGMGMVRAAIQAGHDPDQDTTNRYGAGTLALYHAYLAAAKAVA